MNTPFTDSHRKKIALTFVNVDSNPVPAMYDARKIANFLIARRETHKFDLTNLRLNKLLYFIHGWALTHRQEGLVRNHFIAWQLGPVIRPVYDSFKEYERKPITEPARYLDYVSGQNRPVPYDDISDGDAGLIESIFHSYDKYTTNRLVDISHEPGGPWHMVYSARLRDIRLSPRIPNDLIRKHFMRELGGGRRH